MFGMGMGELLLIMVVALLVVGPDKLPQAAKAIGKGIRDFRRHTLDLQSTLEQDENLGEAVRELRSALRDDPFRQRPAPRPPASTPSTGTSSASASTSDEESASPPAIVPAAGAVAKEPAAPPASSPVVALGETPGPVDAGSEARPGTAAASKADDPANG